ncbi:MAG TPA: hypothetical protein VF233_02210 [Nitrososphaeraceae archaeon]|jgi:hypothetical protein
MTASDTIPTLTNKIRKEIKLSDTLYNGILSASGLADISLAVA